MSVLEIIHLRSSVEPVDSLIDRIKESIWAEGGGTDVATLYRRHGLETDVAIHIRHCESPVASTLAVHLANALKEFGLVEHSVWEEVGSGVSSAGGGYHVAAEGAPR
jgi:hypothetical protein